MKNLELTQMEGVQGGCTDRQMKAMAVAGAVVTATMAIPFSWIVTGPTAIGLTVGALYCAFK